MVHTSNGGASKCAIRKEKTDCNSMSTQAVVYASNNDKVNDLRQRMCPVDDGDSSRRIGHGRNCLVQRHVELSATRRKQNHLQAIERHVEPTTFSYVFATLKLHLVISSQRHEAPTQADVATTTSSRRLRMYIEL